MTMIDADRLLEMLRNCKEQYFDDNGFNAGYKTAFSVMTQAIKDIIEELAEPAPKPQESVFDEDGWCWDMEKVPLNTDVLVLVTGEGYTKMSVGSKSFKNGDLNIEISDTWNNCSFHHLAWCPLPPIPQKGDL